MKKYIALLTCLTAAAVLTGCMAPMQGALNKKVSTEMQTRGYTAEGEVLVMEVNGSRVVTTAAAQAERQHPWKSFFAKSGDYTLNALAVGATAWAAYEVYDNLDGSNDDNSHRRTVTVSDSSDVTVTTVNAGRDSRADVTDTDNRMPPEE